MKLRHILEYEDHEIQDLLGDLETIGQATKRTYSLWVALPSFMTHTGYTKKPKILIALGRPFWSSGTLKEDMSQILKSLRSGDFTRPDLPGMDWKTLGGWPIGTYSPEDPESRRWAKDTIKFLDLPRLKFFFGTSKDSLGKTLDSLREEILERLHPGSREVINPGVALVYGNPEDEDLLNPPIGSLYQASTGGERVVIEDLTAGDKEKNHRIYLRHL